jgi:CheY-like chemotaxis protein
MGYIFVVDDQPDIRELLKAFLDLHGHVTELIPSGCAALARLDSGATPDLIVLDVQMPEKDGWDTLDEIRSRYGELGPRVVLCTVKGHPRDLLHGWTLGCDGYVWKPFDLKLLAEEIDRVLARDAAGRANVRRRAVGEANLLLRASD